MSDMLRFQCLMRTRKLSFSICLCVRVGGGAGGGGRAVSIYLSIYLSCDTFLPRHLLFLREREREREGGGEEGGRK